MALGLSYIAPIAPAYPPAPHNAAFTVKNFAESIIAQPKGYASIPAESVLSVSPAKAGRTSFHRIRLEYVTTSDWTTLEIEDTENVLTMRRMRVIGEPTRLDTRLDKLSLNQTIASSRDGQRVGVIVDYAISSNTWRQSIRFLLKKGALNWSTVRIFIVSADKEELLLEIDHQGVVSGQAGTNPLSFSLNLDKLTKTSRPEKQFIKAPVNKMLWAFYYPWYRMDYWNGSKLKDHPAESYTSADSEAILTQIEQAQSAGIDGFISSWWGPGHYTDDNLKTLLDIAKRKDFSVAIYFETLKDGQARDADEIYDWLAYAISTYRDEPAFMKVDGRPLIVVWASNSVPLPIWGDIFARLRERGLDAVYLAQGVDPASLDVFDGFHEYSVFTRSGLNAAFAATTKSARYYPLLSESPRPKIAVSTVQPGYDERLIPDRSGRFKEREDGAFYELTFQAAVASNPDWIFITSWNEWAEHTYIEPSELYGNQYLQITRRFADEWKKRGE